MPKKYPPLTPSDIRAILKAWGFAHDHTRGSHEYWALESMGGRKHMVTIDTGKAEFGDFLIKSMIAQSGLSRERFYCATRTTARKINKDRLKRLVAE